MKYEMDDLEDGEEFNSNVIKTKKKRRNTETNLSNPDEAEFVEYVLMDLRNPEELNKFKNMKYLSLIQQGIQSIESIASAIPNILGIEFLCLNENLIQDLKFVEKFVNLKELQVNFNQITKIDYINSLKCLEKFWICENKLRRIENVPLSIKSLWVAMNSIEDIPESIKENQNLIEFNLGGNALAKLEELFILQDLKNLRSLSLHDVNFGENPICLLNNYRTMLVHHLPQLRVLDQILITEGERNEVEASYRKKSMFYRNKVRHNYKLYKSLTMSMKSYITFFTLFKHYQVKFFSIRMKMLHHLQEEEQEKDSCFVKDKLGKCLGALDLIASSFNKVKDFMRESNDLMILINFYEFESGGNLRLEPGNLEDKWAKSCIELMKAKLSQSFMTKHSIKGINFNKVFRIFNKKQRIIYDSMFDYLSEVKPDENKSYEFLFFHIDKVDYKSLLSLIFEQDLPSNLLLTNTLDSPRTGTRILIICKCLTFESQIEKVQEKISPDATFDDVYKNLKSLVSPLNILKTSSSDNERHFYLYKNSSMILPEYLIEYDYMLSNNNDTVTSTKAIQSSYTTKTELSPCESFVSSCRFISTADIAKYYSCDLLNKIRSPKVAEWDEVSNSHLFFSKESILSLMNKCFNFNSDSSFIEEMNKIKEKLTEMLQIVKSPSTLNNLDTVTKVNLFNCNITNLDTLLAKINLEEIRVPVNYITSVDLCLISENLKVLDVSHNFIDKVNLSKGNNSLEIFDFSFNLINNSDMVKNLLDVFSSLKQINYFCNPFPKNFPLITPKPSEGFMIPLDLNSSEILKSYFTQSTMVNPIQMTLDELKENSLVNKDLKLYDVVYDSYSFSNKYSHINIFRESVSRDKHLNALILTKKKLASIPKEFSFPLKDISILYLNLNRITHIDNLHLFPKLIELHIQNNKISQIQNLPLTLIKLDISNNLLNDLNGIQMNGNLEWLNVESNMLMSLTEVLSLTRLTELHAACNSIGNLQDCLELKKLTELSVLDLTGNQVSFKGDEFRINLIYYLPNLKVLNRIPIEKSDILIAREYFDGRLTHEVLEKKLGRNFQTEELLELDLSASKLKDFEGLFDSVQYPMLRKLNLSRNQFTTFTIFGSLPNLVELNLNSNLFEKILNRKEKLTSRSAGIYGIVNLEHLEISENALGDLYGISILKNLKNLTLRQNNINKVEPLDGLVNLNFLDLSFNKLRNIEKSNIGHLPNLKILLCDNNYIKNINAFTKLPSIVFLSFESNKVSEYSNIERLVECLQLKELTLINSPICKLNGYRSSLIKKLPNLSKLDGMEITKEEREMVMMDCPLNSNQNDYAYPGIISGNFNVGYKDKLNMKVNIVNLDMRLGFQPMKCDPDYNLASAHRGLVSPTSKKNSNDNIYHINLPQIVQTKSSSIARDLMLLNSKFVGDTKLNSYKSKSNQTNIKRKVGNKNTTEISSSKQGEGLNEIIFRYGMSIQKQNFLADKKPKMRRPNSNNYNK